MEKKGGVKLDPTPGAFLGPSGPGLTNGAT